MAYTFTSNRFFLFSCFLECCKCTRIRFHCANDLVVLRSCARYREYWSCFACSQTGLLVIAKPNLVGLCRLSELYAKVDDKRLGKSVSDILCLIACSNKQAAIHLRMRSDELDFKSSRSRRQNLTTAI